MTCHYIYKIALAVSLILLLIWYAYPPIYEDSIKDFSSLSASSSVDDPLQHTEDEVDTLNDRPATSILEAIPINLMLNYVINCESSNRHNNIWGSAGEYGILQYKEKSFYWLAEKYDFVGEWKSKQDQITLFLLAVEGGDGDHWTCWRQYQNL